MDQHYSRWMERAADITTERDTRLVLQALKASSEGDSERVRNLADSIRPDNDLFKPALPATAVYAIEHDDGDRAVRLFNERKRVSCPQLRIPVIELALLAVLFLAACGDEADPGEPGATPPPDTLPGTWSGLLPCGNCPGIDATLWLRPDGRFAFEQRYRADDVSSAERATAHALGRWEWRDDGQVLMLTGEGPPREFGRPDADTLFMHTASPLEHRLDRQSSDFNFDGVISLRALVRASSDGYLLRECRTGYELPVASGGDYRRFSVQFRSIVPRGESAPLEFEGRFNWDGKGAPASITIERFVRLLSRGGC